MDIEELIETLTEMLPEKTDYAELVGAENWPEGYMYVYSDPESYIIDEAVTQLKRLLAENKQLRANLVLQTALAQNGQSAIDTNKQLTRQINTLQIERDAAIKDLKKVLWDDDVCEYCKYHHKCQGKECEFYIEGIGMSNEENEYFDWKWSCKDFKWGTCEKLENTPCNGCNSQNHFEWRGVQYE